MTHNPPEVMQRRDKPTPKGPWLWSVYKLVEYGECKTEEGAVSHCRAVKEQIEQGLA